MKKYVAFLRAINVAGHASVKMSELKEAFASAGCKDVRTYIQSGNVIFEAPDEEAEVVFRRVRVELRDLLGGEPVVLFRTLGGVQRLVRRAPFKSLESDAGAKLYVTFLSQKPASKPTLPLVSAQEALEVIDIKNLEVFIVSRRKKNGMYGFPNNFIEKQFGVRATSRNWSTLRKIAELSR